MYPRSDRCSPAQITNYIFLKVNGNAERPNCTFSDNKIVLQYHSTQIKVCCIIEMCVLPVATGVGIN